MKTNSRIIILFAFLLLVLQCKEDEKDTPNPSILSFGVTNRTYTEITVQISSNVDAVAYVGAVEHGATALDENTIKTTTHKADIDLPPNDGISLVLSNLELGKDYDIYALVEDKKGQKSDITKITISTQNVNFRIQTIAITNKTLQFTVNSHIAGILTIVAQPTTNTDLTTDNIADAPGAIFKQLQANNIDTITFSNLTPLTDYKIFYRLENEFRETLIFESIPRRTSINFFVASSTPTYNATGVKVYNTITVNFNRNIEINPNGSMYLQSVNGVQNNLPITLSNIVVDGNTITLDSSNYFRRASNLPPKNMHFGQEYRLVIDNAIKMVGVDAYFSDEAIKFTTQTHPNYDYTVRTDNEFTASLNWNSLSSYHQQQLTAGKTLHNYSRVGTESLTGDNVKVGIWDTGVFPGSEVYDAVVYQKIVLEDIFIGDITPSYYNHGTQMCRYALNYAPKINIYDLFKSAVPQGINSAVLAINDIQKSIDEDIDILSLSGSGIEPNSSLAVSAINNGMIIATSLGNIGSLLNDTNSYEYKEKFLPYYQNLNNSTGAFITLQAIVEEGVNSYSSIRSKAGHAKHYTLCLLETGIGATSQATATFSGIMAIMIEANRTNNTNYTPRQLAEILFETAVDIGATGVDNIFGHGYIDIDAAITKLKTGTAPTFSLYQNMDSGVSNFFSSNK
ncbi:MAG: S8 family serine peptidase [Bacteroidales bacterium]|nr:S8 family serine peptidase [Bacteroidales bacterium]